ncbi:tetratricopeptide repeat protein [Helicobacter mustelae]|uniref:tetratricopeptide repeat protein n=1 Tax=Helicobacter mustelae TaxID=217 RepID=UPI0002E803ED|nr:ATP-dependent nuclease subunit B [Helicobacter mustelae]
MFGDAKEDLQIFLGVDALVNGDFKRAKEIYTKLYEETKQIAYARQLSIVYASSGDLGDALKYALLYQNVSKDTKDLPTSKIIVDSYIKKGELKKAIVLLEAIKQQEDTPMLDNILGTLYLNQKQFNKALPLLEEYYRVSKEEEALKKILAIYFAKNENEKAVEKLEDFLKNSWCSEDLCIKAISVFNQFNKNAIALKIFKEHYEHHPNIQNARYYLQVLINQKKFDKAEEIAKEFPFDDALLLDLLVAQNKWKEASLQAKKIYDSKKEAKYLAWSAIYYYQSQNKIKKPQLKKIIAELEQAIEYRNVQREVNKENPNNEDAYFYNFLGYMLIEHDLGIRKGIALIKKALQVAPNSIAYIDSLAWGYYKLGDCAQAQGIFANIPRQQVEQDGELKKHFDLIKKCAH